jgi:hypothetical protein
MPEGKARAPIPATLRGEVTSVGQYVCATFHGHGPMDSD